MSDRPSTVNGVRVPYERTVRSLVAVAWSSGPGRWAAFQALALHPNPTSLSALVDFTHHPEWSVRRAAINAIGQHREGQQAQESVLRRLEDTSPFVRRAALTVSARLGITDARSAVLIALREPSSETQGAALAAIDTFWQPQDFEIVFPLSQGSVDEEIRRQAAWILWEHADKQCWRRLFAVWHNDVLPRHRGWAAQLLGRFGSPEDLPTLSGLLSDADGHVRRETRLAKAKLLDHTDL